MKKLLCLSLLFAVCSAVSAREWACCIFADSDERLYEDENVQLVLATENDEKIVLIVRNKTEKILYLDKATSFVYTNGAIESLFSSSSFSDSYGGIAMTFYRGFGMPAGTIQGTSRSSARTVYEQRIEICPPKSVSRLPIESATRQAPQDIRHALDAMERNLDLASQKIKARQIIYYSRRNRSERTENIRFIGDPRYFSRIAIDSLYITPENPMPSRKNPQIREIKVENLFCPMTETPLLVEVMLTYADDEDFTRKREIRISNRIETLIAGKRKKALQAIRSESEYADRSRLVCDR